MKKILLSLMLIGLVSGAITASTLAVFTATATNSGNVFSTGTLILGTTPATGLFNASGMKPGDSVSQDLTIVNSGSLALKYDASSSRSGGDEDLYQALQLQVKRGEETLYAGGLNNFSLSQRTLNGETSETLSFTVSLPSNVGNDLQGKTANVTFSFNASQE